MTATLIVHHLGISQSERIVWLCEELGIAYDLKIYDRDPVTRMAPAAYKALHPMGIAPVITDGDLVLGESGAIVDYIAARYGDGQLTLKPDDAGFADQLFWSHFANGSLVSNEMIGMVSAYMGTPADHPGLAMVNERRGRAFAMIEAHLANHTYFAGDVLTLADIMMVFALTTMRVFSPRDLSGFPNILAYLQRIAARPAYQRAMAKGDPGMPLLLT